VKNINDFNAEARFYDLLEDKNRPLFDAILRYLAPVFRKERVRTILDATCGTGAQAIPLSKMGFRVLGSDKAPALLKIARGKSRSLPRVKFALGDVRYSRFGRFDAVISMLNSLGYLSKADFRKAVSNINANLPHRGLLVFDNTNKGYLDPGRFATGEYIDTSGEISGVRFVRFGKAKYDKRSGLLNTRWKAMIQEGFGKLVVRRGLWKRQTYTIRDLRHIFQATGFRLEKVLDRTLTRFDERKSFAYLVIARKVGPPSRRG